MSGGYDSSLICAVAYMHIPKEILDRPKTGFAIPLDKWLRTELKEKVYEAMDKDFLERQEIIMHELCGIFLYFKCGMSSMYGR